MRSILGSACSVFAVNPIKLELLEFWSAKLEFLVSTDPIVHCKWLLVFAMNLIKPELPSCKTGVSSFSRFQCIGIVVCEHAHVFNGAF